jgi:DNA-binding SARP family transcriptional activator
VYAAALVLIYRAIPPALPRTARHLRPRGAGVPRVIPMPRPAPEKLHHPPAPALTPSQPSVSDADPTHPDAPDDQWPPGHPPGVRESPEPASRTGLRVTIGHDTRGPVVIDLLAHHGLGLTGPGADTCAATILTTLLTPPPDPTDHRVAAQVVIPTADANRLGEQTPDTPPTTAPHPDALPASTTLDPTGGDDGADQRVYRAPTLGIALTYLEQHILTRARTHHSPTEPTPLVLFAHPDPSDHPRLRAILAEGARHRITAVLTTPWPTGTTVSLARDGTVHASAARDAALSSSIRVVTTDHQPPTAPRDGRNASVADACPTPSTEQVPLSASQATSIAPGQVTPSAHHSPAVSATTIAATARPGESDSRRCVEPAPSPTHAPPSTGGDEAAHQQPSGMPPGPDTPASTAASATRTADRPTGHRETVAPVAADGESTAMDGQEAVLVIECFGGLRIYAPHATDNAGVGAATVREITARLSPQDARLVACLALHPQGLSTEGFLAIGWPNIPSSTASPRLRTALNHLRSTLREATNPPGGAFAAYLNGRYHLGAHPEDPRLRVDYTAFTQAVHSARTHTGADRVDALHQILALHTGPLLAEVDLDWPELGTLCEAADRAATGAVRRLSEHYARHDSPQAIEHLHGLLAWNPSAEHLAELLITLLLRNHDHGGALCVYTELATHLNQLGRQPTTALTRLLHNP